MGNFRLEELDRQIASAAARLRRLRLLIERQLVLGTPSHKTEVLVVEVEGFLTSLRAQRGIG